MPRPRDGVGLEPALDDRNVGEVQGKPLGPEDVLNHRQILRAARQAILDELAQAALEQLDVTRAPREFWAIGMSCSVSARSSLTVSVVFGAASGFGNVAIVEQLVYGGRLCFLFGEAIALTKRRDFVRVDAIDQSIELFS